MNQKLFVVALRCGRLANRLVLFANFIALAEEQGHRLVNFTFHSYAHLFEVTRRDIYCHYPARQRKSCWDLVPGIAPIIRGTRIFYRTVRALNWLNSLVPFGAKAVMTLREFNRPGTSSLEGPELLARIRDARIIFVDGWRFRAPNYVRRHAEKIRAYFQPVAAIDHASRAVVERLRRDADIVVGVHLRQGDYRRWQEGKFFFPVTRYHAWMREMAEQFPSRKVAFLVCSDEPRNEQEFPGLTVGFGAGSPAADLCALARCDYIFGPHSTFSRWASFYGGTPLFQLHNTNNRLECKNFTVSDLGD